MSDLPAAPGLRCSYLLRYPDVASQCPNEATSHIVWTVDMENGLACDLHHPDLLGSRYVASHGYDPICSVPGACWMGDHCEVEDDGLPILAIARCAPSEPLHG